MIMTMDNTKWMIIGIHIGPNALLDIYDHSEKLWILTNIQLDWRDEDTVVSLVDNIFPDYEYRLVIYFEIRSSCRIAN